VRRRREEAVSEALERGDELQMKKILHGDVDLDGDFAIAILSDTAFAWS
jgi:hypothetical protein